MGRHGPRGDCGCCDYGTTCPDQYDLPTYKLTISGGTGFDGTYLGDVLSLFNYGGNPGTGDANWQPAWTADPFYELIPGILFLNMQQPDQTCQGNEKRTFGLLGAMLCAPYCVAGILIIPPPVENTTDDGHYARAEWVWV